MAYKDKIWYGGDYNPDQWDEATWDVDFELFKEAHITMLTLPVFSWSRIEISPGVYDFDWLYDILDRAKAAGISICLATSTAVQPAWLSKLHPEILPTDAHGHKRRFGGRVKFCPNSVNYKIYAKRLVQKFAEIAQKYDNIEMWHIGNEYDNYCYCDHCKAEFQNWVKDRYQTIEEVNKRWVLNFWGHQIHSFDEIEIPDFRSENWEMAGLPRTNFQTINLDYMRFMNDSILSCYINELEVIREMTPDIPVTTNFMGAFKPLDYFKWAPYIDVISWDHYPSLMDGPYKGAMHHDLMRSLKKDRPFWLMEQSPSQQNWSPYNTLKRPGQLRLQSYQTVARGADAIMYFQMRRSIGNCEKFHGALIDHYGGNQTRVFKECQQIGEELERLTPIIGSTVETDIGIVFDWENWWGIEMSSGPTIQLNYQEQIALYYKSLYQNNKMVDFINDKDDLSKYRVIFAPMLYMVKEALFNKLEAFVKDGGTLVLTTFSGIVDENDRVTTSGYPGKFREMAGIWVEEIDGLYPEMSNTIKGFKGNDFKCHMLCDIIKINTAETLATYGCDFYEGMPVITVNAYHKGRVFYIGTVPEASFVDALVSDLIQTDDARVGLEVSVRKSNDSVFTFYMNHSQEDHEVTFDSNRMDLISGQVSNRFIVKHQDLIIIREKI